MTNAANPNNRKGKRSFGNWTVQELCFEVERIENMVAEASNDCDVTRLVDLHLMLSAVVTALVEKCHNLERKLDDARFPD